VPIEEERVAALAGIAFGRDEAIRPGDRIRALELLRGDADHVPGMVDTLRQVALTRGRDGGWNSRRTLRRLYSASDTFAGVLKEPTHNQPHTRVRNERMKPRLLAPISLRRQRSEVNHRGS
jgi:hypothetical protein